MKTIRLSSPADRRNAWGFAVLLFALIAVVMLTVRFGVGYFILISLCSLFGVAMTAAYLSAVIKAAVRIDGDSHLRVYGLVSSTEDFSGAVSVKTVPVEMGPIRSRVIALCNSQGEAVCTMSTMFTSREGVMAEPAAMELAELLDLDFQPTVEKWKYDKDAMREHKAEEKKQRKEKRSRRKNGASPVYDTDENGNEADSGENYDAMDDER